MRFLVKRIFYGIAFLLVAPLFVTEWLARAIMRRDVFFSAQAEFLTLFPGSAGVFLRNAYYFATLEECALDCEFSFGSRFTHSNARVGQRVYLGFNCIVGQAHIGDDTMLADRVSVLSGRHQHGTTRTAESFQAQVQHFQTVTIGKNCWIGTSAIVMADIGEDVIIGAGSVVTKPIEAGSVAVGNPCRPIRKTDAASAAAQPAERS